jgi:hypothetical protein
MAYCRDHRGREPLYVSSIDAFSESALRTSLPVGPLFVHGVNFGDLWPRHQAFREKLLERFPDREIIQPAVPPSHYRPAISITVSTYSLSPNSMFSSDSRSSLPCTECRLSSSSTSHGSIP